MTYVPITGKPGEIVFIKRVDTDNEDELVCMIYPNHEKDAQFILHALNAREGEFSPDSLCEVCRCPITVGLRFHQECYDSELAGPMDKEGLPHV